MEMRVEKGNFRLSVKIERCDSRARKEFAKLPADLPFNVLAEYDPYTQVTTVDISADEEYAKWSAVRETLNFNGSKFFGECTEKNFELSDQPVRRRKSVEYLLVNRIIPEDYKEQYCRLTIEFYELMLCLSAYDSTFSPEIIKSFKAGKHWLEQWLVDNRYKKAEQ
ncbi:hypothetical protein IKH83_00575 [Candidatus Saccharibacteria bacterium]|nr:hypothetical protein [Candidatus Saccharibacteria bacterium]